MDLAASQVLDLLAGAEVIGLGEATHGDAQSQVFRGQLIEALLERRGQLILGLERNERPTGRMVDSYLRTGEPSVGALVADDVMYPWCTAETVELFDRLRRHCIDGTKVEVFGFDVQDSTAASPSGHARDAAMASKVLERARVGAAPIVLWAHNLHICKAPVMMGGHLAKSLGEKYLALGCVFSQGSYNRMPDLLEQAAGPAPTNSVENVMACAVDQEPGVAATTQVPGLDQPRPMRHTGSSAPGFAEFQEFPAASGLFDVLVHFARVGPSTVLHHGDPGHDG